MEKNYKSGIMFSKKLWGLIKEMEKTHLVALAIVENIQDIDNLGFSSFHITDDGYILCSNSQHEIRVSVYKWARNIIVKTSVANWGGFLESLMCQYEIKDTDIESFGNYILALSKKHNYTFEIIEHQKIHRAFSMERVKRGRLGDSCMHGYPEYFGMLRNCPDVSALCMIDSDGVLIGRALLWNTDIGGMEKVRFLDRFYTSQDYLDFAFIKWASENKVWRKKHYMRHEAGKLWISPAQKEASVIASVDIKVKEYSQYPYLDTFMYGNDGWISNDSYNSKYMYRSVFGIRERVKK